MKPSRSQLRRSRPLITRNRAVVFAVGIMAVISWPVVSAVSQSAPSAADLDIDVVPSAPEASSGAPVTYVITVTNEDATAAGPFTVVNELPDETLFVSCSAVGGGVCGGAGNIRSIAFPSLAAETSVTAQVVATVGCVPDGADIFDTAELTRAASSAEGEETENETAYVTVRNVASSDHLTGDVLGPLTVAAGHNLCVAGGRVVGPITVNSGGGLSLAGAKVSRGVIANQPGLVRICGSQIAGGLTVTGATGPVTVGDGTESCAGNQVTSPGVTLTGNKAGLVLSANAVVGLTRVNGNSDSESGFGILVQGNTLYGNLDCAGNTPAPVNGDQPNTVKTGAKTGQCAGI